MATAKKESKEKMVRIRLPLTKENQSDVFVSVNERTWQIQRGKFVDVPECVAKVIQNSEDMQMVALEYETKKASK